MLENTHADLVSETELARAARAAREAAGLTQEQAAELLGVKQPTIAQAEREPQRRLTKLRIAMIEALSSARVDGPFWCIIEPSDEKVQ